MPAGPTPSTSTAPPDPGRYRSLAHEPGARSIEVIDQRALPAELVTVRIGDAETAARAIAAMWVRGAPLIGAVGAYGLAMALDRDAGDDSLARAFAALDAARPTAVNLRWALSRVRARVAPLAPSARADAAWDEADRIAAEDVAINHAIGVHGLALLREAASRNGGRVSVMTHCNTGALATLGYGTATAPLFLAHAEGIDLEVLVSETRPRMQGAKLTAWEMAQRGIAHTVFVDGASGALLRAGGVDLVIVGADRVTRNGDVCNKIGTYDKALAARDNGVPFYVALPSPSFDASLARGDDTPIEHRAASEVMCVAGHDADGVAREVAIGPAGSRALNPAFDVTPARLVSGWLTERGLYGSAEALHEGLRGERLSA